MFRRAHRFRPLHGAALPPFPKKRLFDAPIVLGRVHIGAMLEQQLGHRRVPFGSGVMERNVPAKKTLSQQQRRAVVSLQPCYA